MNEDLFLDIAKSFLGTPYIWGAKSGVGKTGLDCSGFVMEVLRAFGFLKGDYNAQEIHAMLLSAHDKPPVRTKLPSVGYVLFFGTSLEKITHVAMALNSDLMIECGGGDHTTINLVEAIKKNACVRVRPINHRTDFLDAINPFRRIL